MSDERPTIKFITAIVADDIRREASGKEIIIGVYASNIIFRTINPSGGIVISISLIFETRGIGDIPIELRVTSPSGESIGIIQGIVHSQEILMPGQINSTALTAVPLPIPVEGNIVIEARQYDEEWQTIRVIPVIADPNAPGLSAGVPSVASIAIALPSSPPPPDPPETSSSRVPSPPARPTRRRRS